VGNLLQYILTPHSTIPVLGASGAIAGVLGAYFVLFPYSKIKTLIPLGFIVFVNISAPFMLGYWFIIQLVSGFGSLAGVGQDSGVAFFAHVGGFVAGFAVAQLFKNRTRNVDVSYE